MDTTTRPLGRRRPEIPASLNVYHAYMFRQSGSQPHLDGNRGHGIPHVCPEDHDERRRQAASPLHRGDEGAHRDGEGGGQQAAEK
jgi:hypothetical protein